MSPPAQPGPRAMFVDANPLLLLSVVLVAGTTVGALARRVHLPAVTGQILIGILLGPSVLHWFDHSAVLRLQPLIDFALGLMAVAVGSHLNYRLLANAKKRLGLLLLFEAIFTPLLVFSAAVIAPGTRTEMAALLAAIAVSTAPATILALVRETRAKGVFAKTLIAAVALNNLAAICLFELAHTAAELSLRPGADASWLEIAVAPFRQILASALLGGGAASVLVWMTRSTVRPDRLTAMSITAILLTAGLADFLGVSTLLSCLFLGITLANLTPEKEEIGHAVFDNFEYAIFAAFFTLAGMELQFSYVVPGGLLALLVFVTRTCGKWAAAWVAMRWAQGTRPMRRYLGLALVPQAGLAVGLMLLVTEDPTFASIRDLFLAVVLTVVLLNELFGPVLTRWALHRSGEAGRDRARLIDFLHEENIVTDLDARTKEEAIAELVDVLVRTNRVRVDREALLSSVLERERQTSTCLGDGFAIPHGTLPEGDRMLGAMGISRSGLWFDSPDGKPVHCMVLLATPESERGRHLSVLAALSRAIGSDRGVQQQLYHARTPAHAYDLLHAEEAAEDFNVYLEADEEPSA